MSKLTYHEGIPDYFFELTQENVLNHLKEMTLFYHKGKNDKTVLISTMLHGNETSGLEAIKQYFRDVLDKGISDLSFLVLLGNPLAFSQNKRLIKGQLDRNRIWQLKGDHADHLLAKSVIDKIVNFPLVCAIDIHNNTGKNPYFCCVNRLDKSTLGLASLFGADGLFFEDPTNAFTTFMGRFCPSVTLECGVSGDEVGVRKAILYLKNSIRFAENGNFSELEFTNDLFKSFGKFKIPVTTKVYFKPRKIESSNQDILADSVWFYDDLEKFNLREVPAGEKLGQIYGKVSMVRAESEFSEDLFPELFQVLGCDIVVKKKFFMAMVTKNVDVAKADCFFYFLKKLSTN